MMDITGLARFSGGYASTRTKKAETGKATSFDEECGKTSMEKDRPVPGKEKTEASAFSGNFGAQTVCSTIFEENDDGSYTADVCNETGGVLATVRIPPNVVNRMGNDSAYAKRVWSQTEQFIGSQVGQPMNETLPLDKDGNITSQNATDYLSVRLAKADNSGRNANKTRAEGQKNSELRMLRMKYAPVFVSKHNGYCVAEFLCSDSTRWDPSEMTEAERLTLQEMTGGLPAICIPPNVTRRMDSDDAYADRIRSQIERYIKSQGGELKDAKLPLDEEGNIIDQDAPDSLFVKVTGADDDGKGIWKARAERQDEYIKYCQQKEMEHRIALSMEFAAQRKGGRML